MPTVRLKWGGALHKKLDAAIRERQSAAPIIRDMPLDNHRRYTADAVAEHPRRQKEAIAKGTPELTAANVRVAFAEAAIAILATDAHGSKEIQSVLSRIFSDKPGADLTISARASSGRI